MSCSSADGQRMRSKKGCDSCRQIKLKCDEERPSCGRCSRLDRACTWPRLEPSLQAKRRGHGSLKSRQGTWLPPPIARKSASIPAAESSLNPAEVNLVLSLSEYAPTPESPGCDGWWTNIEVEPHKSEGCLFSGSLDDVYFSSYPQLQVSGGVGSPPSTMLLPNSYGSWFLGFEAPVSSPLFDYYTPLPNSLILNSSEYNYLRHFQTTFSLQRTSKDPNWSTHKLLLDIGSENMMIMHFVLAVSMNDICHRQGHLYSQGAQSHFDAGNQLMIKNIGERSPKDYVCVMAGFLFLYLYMTKRRQLQSHRIQQLSLTVLDYVKRHRLENRCLEPDPQDDSTTASGYLSYRDRTILARLIIWIFDEDVKCGFQGFGGCFAEYLKVHRERTLAIYEVSRTVLEAHWGSIYPQLQRDDDDDNAMELEFLWALTILWQDINTLAEGIILNPDPTHLRIGQRFSLLEKKYASVFQASSETTLPRTRILGNADYDVVLFNALRVYFFRSTIMDLGIQTPPEIQQALTNIHYIMQRSFGSSNIELRDRLQLPLFVAGIETADLEFQNWIKSRLSDGRAKTALIQIIDSQNSSGQRLPMPVIRALLSQSIAREVCSLPTSQDSFLESVV